MQERNDVSPFALPNLGRAPLARSLFGAAAIPVEHLLGLHQLNQIYQHAALADDSKAFCDRVLAAMGISSDVSAADALHIPTSGPVVVVANHPYGAIEGVMLASFLLSIRPDAKLMANYLLHRMPPMRSISIAVDPFGGKEAARRNLKPLKEAISHLRGGGLLGIFPSGEVSHLQLGRHGISDPQWNESIGRLVRLTNATVVPVFFDGCNSLFFQLAGLIHPRLRTILLPQELLNKKRHTFSLRVGSPIRPYRMAQITCDRELVEFLRMRTYLLKSCPKSAANRIDSPTQALQMHQSPIAASRTVHDLISDVAALPQSQLLASAGTYRAFVAHATQLPQLLHEIGVQREQTFRSIGEGSGKSLDLDRFDNWYDHLFIWDSAASALVGAYRIGRTDQILARHGMKGLYTKTLFRYNATLLSRIGPALELGRSFIRTEYQREYQPLHLLWRGIGQYVARYPHYRTLFGPVSISSRYQSMSQQLLLSFLRANFYAKDLARFVRAKTPPRTKAPTEWNSKVTDRLVGSIDDVNRTIAEIERGEVGMPILLRHYLRLGGKLLGFNRDHSFSDCIDGLILVDLPKAPRRVLDTYFGRIEAAAYLALHESTAGRAASSAVPAGLAGHSPFLPNGTSR